MSHPKFILVSDPKTPLVGTFVYGMVDQHKELVQGYVKVHGGGWYLKDRRLRGASSGLPQPYPPGTQRLHLHLFPGWNLPGNELDLSEVEWV